MRACFIDSEFEGQRSASTMASLNPISSILYPPKLLASELPDVSVEFKLEQSDEGV